MCERIIKMGRKSTLEKDVKDSLEDITSEIVKVSQIGKAIKNSRLNKRAIILLLQNLTRVNQADIEKILEGLSNLEAVYLKRKT